MKRDQLKYWLSSHAGPAGSCDSWHISSTIVPAGASMVKCGQPTISSRELEGGKKPFAAARPARQLPGVFALARVATALPLDAEAVRHAELEPIGRVAEPVDPARRRPAAGPAPRFPSAAEFAASASKTWPDRPVRSCRFPNSRSRCTPAACRPGSGARPGDPVARVPSPFGRGLG